VATGIRGFDGLVEGGLPKGSNVLVTGAPGTCKTIFGLEYLYSGAQKGENGLYVSIDSSIGMLKQQAERFNWDLDALEESGKLSILDIPMNKNKFNLFGAIEKKVIESKVKRLVFDNLEMFSVNMDLFTIPLGYGGSLASSVSVSASNVMSLHETAPINIDKDMISYTASTDKCMIYLIIEKLGSLGTTNLLITYGSPDKLTVDGVSEFACDGIIALYNELIGSRRVRTMSILKMRNINHSQYIHDFELVKDGISIKPSEEVYK
jgi:KaiC/GvpD/RAD55 family RecA-like ATPase